MGLTVLAIIYRLGNVKICALATDSQALCFKGKQANTPALLKGKETPAPRQCVLLIVLAGSCFIAKLLAYLIWLIDFFFLSHAKCGRQTIAFVLSSSSMSV